MRKSATGPNCREMRRGIKQVVSQYTIRLLLTTLLAFDTAKNSPSEPVGAREAIQDDCLGLHKTSPRVRNTCQMQMPAWDGKIATNMGDAAMIQRPDNCDIACVRP